MTNAYEDIYCSVKSIESVVRAVYNAMLYGEDGIEQYIDALRVVVDLTSDLAKQIHKL